MDYGHQSPRLVLRCLHLFTSPSPSRSVTGGQEPITLSNSQSSRVNTLCSYTSLLHNVFFTSTTKREKKPRIRKLSFYILNFKKLNANILFTNDHESGHFVLLGLKRRQLFRFLTIIPAKMFGNRFTRKLTFASENLQL